MDIIWKKYKKIDIKKADYFGNIYIAKNKTTEEYFEISEINKKKLNKIDIKNQFKTINNINSENLINVKEIIEIKDSYLLFFELCFSNLEEYMEKRKVPLSIKEIKKILLDLNKGFKNLYNNGIIHSAIKPSNILLSVNQKKIDKTCFKISNTLLSKVFEESKLHTKKSYNISSVTSSPESLKGETINSKSDIWSLGIVIYYMLYKKYPYNGTEYEIVKQIELNKKLPIVQDKYLNDLLNKMLNPNVDKRISWEQYFQHPFLKYNSFECHSHLKNYYSYCSTCQYNICEKCINNHSFHKIIPFDQIGFNNDEILTMNCLFNEIENKFNDMKQNHKNYMNNIKSINTNTDVLDEYINDYKKYYINYLEIIKKKIDNNKFDYYEENNYILCYYDIKKNLNEKENYLNEPIRILNSNENAKGFFVIKNEDHIKENCELYLNDEKIDFCYNYKFPKEGLYKLKILLNNELININHLFYKCNKLRSLDLSNLNKTKVVNMNLMLYYCTNLLNLNLSNFNTENVINMSSLFEFCSSLTSIDLSNFNTSNVIDMNNMFSGCYSLKYLDLHIFNTSKVTNMSQMFSGCSSLTYLDLSNFNTDKVTNMSEMFSYCLSLITLNLSNFNTNNVIKMVNIFLKINKNCEIITNDKNLLLSINNN